MRSKLAVVWSTVQVSAPSSFANSFQASIAHIEANGSFAGSTGCSLAANPEFWQLRKCFSDRFLSPHVSGLLLNGGGSGNPE